MKNRSLNEWMELLLQHNAHKKTQREWDEYAKRHSLPTVSQIKYAFGSWNKMKKQLQVSDTKIYHASRQLSDEELLAIASKHREYFTSQKEWDEYAREHGLPSWTVYRRRFKRVADVKRKLNLTNRNRSYVKLSKEDVINLIHEHAAEIVTRSKHDFSEYLKEKKLPSYHHIRKWFTWNQVKEMANIYLREKS
jgi:hypothetical protein